MLLKLGLTGIKRRFGDYAILFSGLIFSSAIFYMFTAMATNQDFLKQNINISSITQVFVFGLILLMMITIVYVWYAQSFLLGMRFKDYGLLMTFGARRTKIAQLVLIETLVIQMGSMVVGIVLGSWLTELASRILSEQLDLSLKSFNFGSIQAMAITTVFFLILACLCALILIIALRRRNLNQIIHAQQQVSHQRAGNTKLLVGSVVGLALLAVGFTAMVKINELQIMAVPIALVAITTGSYLLISSLFTLFIKIVKTKKISHHNLRQFTLGQLAFRIGNYTRMLTMVTILFSLALGAITVGTGYYKQIPVMSTHSSAYTMNISNPNTTARRLMNQLDTTVDVSYDQISNGQYVYYNQAQLSQHPFQVVKNAQSMEQLATAKYQNVDHATLLKTGDEQQTFKMMMAPNLRNKKLVILTDHQFQQQAGQHSSLRLVRVKNLHQSLPTLKKLAKYESAGQVQGMELANSYDMYLIANTLFGGLEFIGLFLGIAFLTMLASCLMFKVLAGARADRRRYEIINKIGATKWQLNRAIMTEIGSFFIIPAFLGVSYVAIGLQMFKKIMYNPYGSFGMAAVILLLAYVAYYLITVIIYRRLVLQKTK